MTRLVPVVLTLLSFSGCTLIDQTTFAPAPEAKAQPAPPQAPVVLDARTPLVTIDYTVASPEYGQLLSDAVHAAQARDANVQFDVVAVLKNTSDIASGQAHATGVMRAIMRDQVPLDRIHLGVRTDPAVVAGQVRVYVR